MTSSKPLDGEGLPAEASVLRLPKPPPDFKPDDWRPDWSVLDPSTADKEHASKHGKPVRVSVWDAARTSIEQARMFRNGPTIVLTLGVQDVLDIAQSTKRPMGVVYDPLSPPDDARSGAEGHAGIEGLERGEGEPKKERKARLDALAERMEILAGPE